MADSTPVQRKEHESSSKEASGDKKPKKDGAMERQYQEELSKRKKRPWWWWRWISCGPVKFLALLLAVPFILNYASLSREAKQLLPKGDLVDIGWGQKLFMRCTGNSGRYKLTVVLDTPVGETSDMWSRVEPLISKYVKVCVYDRAGLGFSDRGYKNTSQVTGDYSEQAKLRDRSAPGTVERAADDLHRALTAAVGDGSPVLLVGVEYSSMVARFYTQVYGHHVASLLLIDPLVETIFDKNSSWQQHWYNVVLPQVNTLYLSSSLGLTRLSLLLGLTQPVNNPDVARLLSKDEMMRKKYLLCQPTHLSSVIDELVLTNESMHQMKAMFRVKPFSKELPVTIATFKDQPSNLPDNLVKEWSRAQQFLSSSIHPNSHVVSLPGQDPTVFLLQPGGVASLILTAVRKWRNPQM